MKPTTEQMEEIVKAAGWTWHDGNLFYEISPLAFIKDIDDNALEEAYNHPITQEFMQKENSLK